MLPLGVGPTVEALSHDFIVPPWRPRSILPTEALAVVGVGKHLRCDLVIESGVRHGRSLEWWCIYFGGINVVGIDLELRPEARQVGAIRKAMLVEADSVVALPKLLDKADCKRALVFIDGPKGETAMALANRCLEYGHVAVVAVHDTHKGSAVRPQIEASPYFWFATDGRKYCDRYKHLDHGESRYDPVQDYQWVPGGAVNGDGKLIRDFKGSHGFTVSFLKGKSCSTAHV